MFKLISKIKVNVAFKILSAVLMGTAAAAGAQNTNPLVNTNVDALYKTGTGTNPYGQTDLKQGLYVVTEFGSILTDAYVIVKDYVNDPSKKLVLVMPRSYKLAASGWTKNTEIGYFFQARPWQDGRYVLTSLYVDDEGTMQVESEGNRKASGIFISWANNESASGTKLTKDYVLTGVNGAVIGNRGLRMRSAEVRVLPSISPGPHNGLFSSGFTSRPNIMVNGDRLAIFDEAPANPTFRLVGLNGGDEATASFSTLHATEVDMLAGSEATNRRIEKLAFFINNCWDEETFVIARPHPSQYGAYIMKFYPYKQYILEKLLDVPVIGTLLKFLFE